MAQSCSHLQSTKSGLCSWGVVTQLSSEELSRSNAISHFASRSWHLSSEAESSPESRCFSDNWPELILLFKSLQEDACFFNRPAVQILCCWTVKYRNQLDAFEVLCYSVLWPHESSLFFFLYCGIVPVSNPSTAIKNSWGTLGRITAKAVRAYLSTQGCVCRKSVPETAVSPPQTFILSQRQDHPHLRGRQALRSLEIHLFLLMVRYPCTVCFAAALITLFLGQLKLASSSQSSVE